ncbi:MAG: NeuD/PglB/VioB family sugar acetyltransferase [Muribaculaceae bacterium]|nr:NeuD/PglB/VioB family sugar acetyltransferase [Muribaculaceae bacterium]MDE6754877.1 NeuD/PglB/VioB family sugar acetyltransferase [Muribaculaceae bacterium]
MNENFEEIIFVGGGGHALSLLESLPDNMKMMGYTALSESEKISGKWLGDDASDENLLSLPYSYHIAFVYAGSPCMNKRKSLIERFENAGAKFATIISPTALVSRNSVIGEGSAVLSGAIVNRAVLGRHVVINTGAIIEHDCHIADNSFIGPGAVVGGGVSIGENCFIGLGARLRNGIKIASGVTVGMGAVVTRSLTEPGIYYGFPLRRHPLI